MGRFRCAESFLMMASIFVTRGFYSHGVSRLRGADQVLRGRFCSLRAAFAFLRGGPLPLWETPCSPNPPASAPAEALCSVLIRNSRLLFARGFPFTRCRSGFTRRFLLVTSSFRFFYVEVRFLYGKLPVHPTPPASAPAEALCSVLIRNSRSLFGADTGVMRIDPFVMRSFPRYMRMYAGVMRMQPPVIRSLV